MRMPGAAKTYGDGYVFDELGAVYALYKWGAGGERRESDTRGTYEDSQIIIEDDAYADWGRPKKP